MVTESVIEKMEQTTLSVKEDNYFEVVLLDIGEFVKTNNTTCVKRNLYDKEGEDYICISYRWGEMTEWVTNATDYRAHVKSFDKSDLWIVCNAILKEPDLKHIKYLWIDAICIDQINMEKRKATIKHMNQIYEHCAYILAIPDLHFSYLKNNPGNDKNLITIINYGRHVLYELINGNNDDDDDDDDDDDNADNEIAVDDNVDDEISEDNNVDDKIDDVHINKTDAGNDGDDPLSIWQKDIDCQLAITWVLLNLRPALHTSHFDPIDFLDQLIQFRASLEYESVLFISDDINDFYDLLKTSLEHLIQREKEDREESLQYRENYLLSNFKHVPQSNVLQNLTSFYEDMGQEMNDELPNIKSLFIKLVFHYNAFNDDIADAIEFLDYIVYDWATRVWVVSEYYIANKNKKKNPMKLTFVSLLKNLCWREEPPRGFSNEDNVYRKFFNIFDIKLDKEKREEMERKNNLIDRVEKKLLVNRSMLNIILNSNATNQVDRFYAIMNLWDKYKHTVKDKNTIPSWNIKDIVDVRLQLYNMLDKEDSIQLLHACSINDGFYYPSFAIAHEKIWLDVEKIHYGKFDEINDMNTDDNLPKLELTFYQNKLNDTDDDDTLVQVKTEFNFKNINEEEFTSNIVSIQYNNEDNKQRLTLKCDIYYEVESIHYLDGKLHLEERQSKGELVIIPFYRFEEVEKNQNNTPSNCYLSVYKRNKVDDDHWMLKKGNEYNIVDSLGHFIKLGGFDIKPNGMKSNGNFIIE